jgi:hypothetical protein
MINKVLRRFSGVRFVRRAQTRSGQPVELRVTEMTLPHVQWWNAHVQPVIDRDPERPDRGWNWLLCHPSHLHPVLGVLPAGRII